MSNPWFEMVSCNVSPHFSCADHSSGSIITLSAALLIRNEWFDLQKTLRSGEVDTIVSPTTDITLHGTWIKHKPNETGGFLIWGEQRFPEVLTKLRGRRPKILRHPYAASPKDIEEILHALAESLMLDEYEPGISDGEAILTLPVIVGTPVPSRQTVMELKGKPGMADCRIGAVYLSTPDALELLSALPLHNYDLPCRLGAGTHF